MKTRLRHGPPPSVSPTPGSRGRLGGARPAIEIGNLRADGKEVPLQYRHWTRQRSTAHHAAHTAPGRLREQPQILPPYTCPPRNDQHHSEGTLYRSKRKGTSAQAGGVAMELRPWN